MTKITETPTEFKDIAPYDDCQVHEKLVSLVAEPGFRHAVEYVYPGIDYDRFAAELSTITTRDEFQLRVIGPFLEALVARGTSGLTVSGLDNVKAGEAYTFITNHRDIVLDASFLNLCFIRGKKPFTQVAIGNNLLIFDWITDLVKLNRSFIVKRDTRVIEALAAAKHLSAYIHLSVNDREESVWIAQREGRAKDSNDVTQESLIKMIGLAPTDSVKTNVMTANLLPVSISYEFDPNDYLKAREFLLKRRDPEYKKSQRDDLFAMETGILNFKGRVHFSIGEPINPGLEQVGDTRQEVVKEACRLIDRSIHCGYKIFPCNYIAYDESEGCNRFAGNYTSEEKAEFDRYIDSRLDMVDVEGVTPEERDYMRQSLLVMYSNPLRNQLAAACEA